MTITSKTSPANDRSRIASGILSRFVQIASVFIVQAAVLFGAAGRLGWVWAWVFLGIYLASMAVNSAFLLRRSPEMVAERGHARLTRGWDKAISGLWGSMQFLAIPLVAGLELRLGWSNDVGLGWHIVGSILFAAGLALFGWAMIANAYFSTAVRIQSERGQTVCRTGPYPLIRHPGYTGTLLQSMSIPLLLGSWWALIPGLLAAALMTARTSLEDRALQAELPGYSDYAHEVRYRLVPGVW